MSELDETTRKLRYSSAKSSILKTPSDFSSRHNSSGVSQQSQKSVTFHLEPLPKRVGSTFRSREKSKKNKLAFIKPVTLQINNTTMQESFMSYVR